jgi:hypothetical protein
LLHAVGSAEPALPRGVSLEECSNACESTIILDTPIGSSGIGQVVDSTATLKHSLSVGEVGWQGSEGRHPLTIDIGVRSDDDGQAVTAAAPPRHKSARRRKGVSMRCNHAGCRESRVRFFSSSLYTLERTNQTPLTAHRIITSCTPIQSMPIASPSMIPCT